MDAFACETEVGFRSSEDVRWFPVRPKFSASFTTTGPAREDALPDTELRKGFLQSREVHSAGNAGHSIGGGFFGFR